MATFLGDPEAFAGLPWQLWLFCLFPAPPPRGESAGIRARPWGEQGLVLQFCLGSLARCSETGAAALERGSGSVPPGAPGTAKEEKAPLFSASALETDSSALKQDPLINHLLDLCSFT